MHASTPYRAVQLVLGLEGVLVSADGPVIARPGLRRFLTLCDAIFDEVVVFAPMPEPWFRRLAIRLMGDGQVTCMFPPLRYVRQRGKSKDVRRAKPQWPETLTLLLDYDEPTATGQRSCWIPIPKFDGTAPDMCLAASIPALACQAMQWRRPELAGESFSAVSRPPTFGLPPEWSVERLPDNQALDLLAVLAGAAAIASDRASAIALVKHPLTTLQGRSLFDLVTSGHTEIAVRHLVLMSAGALG
jgi:hypothetical protein